MKSSMQPDCECSRCSAAKARNLGELGLDELMIVNPAHGATGESAPPPERYFLGEDGALYRAEAVRDGPTVTPVATEGKDVRRAALGLGNYFLGADGALYEIIE